VVTLGVYNYIALRIGFCRQRELAVAHAMCLAFGIREDGTVQHRELCLCAYPDTSNREVQLLDIGEAIPPEVKNSMHGTFRATSLTRTVIWSPIGRK
jgi:hypothetical protein